MTDAELKFHPLLGENREVSSITFDTLKEKPWSWSVHQCVALDSSRIGDLEFIAYGPGTSRPKPLATGSHWSMSLVGLLNLEKMQIEAGDKTYPLTVRQDDAIYNLEENKEEVVPKDQLYSIMVNKKGGLRAEGWHWRKVNGLAELRAGLIEARAKYGNHDVYPVMYREIRGRASRKVRWVKVRLLEAK